MRAFGTAGARTGEAMHTTWRRTTGVLAIAVTLALTGCAQTAQGDPTATATARPTGSSAPTEVRTPTSACGEFASPDAVTALVGGTGAPQAFEHLQSGGIGWKAAWGAWAANGAVCGWGTRSAEQPVDAVVPGTVLIQVVPGMEPAWYALVGEFEPGAGSAYDGAVSRGGSCTGPSCSTDLLVAGAWLHVAAFAEDAALAESDFHDFVQGVVSRFTARPAPTVLPTHQRSCDAPGLRDAVAGAFGAAGVSAPEQGVFTLAQGLVRAGYASTCGVNAQASGRGWQTTVTVLDGVPAELVSAYRDGTDHPGSRPVDVSSLGAGASGLFEPTTDSERTIVDVLVDGHWLNIVTYGTDDSGTTVALARALLDGDWITG